ncbi:RDD family protein [Oceanisphaera pacifica]|uniref:RDD family protein n=1 Tax=Oceanisphaera pacifica TaxID=2818389 RepID=A0ABS3NGF7_9GAMM|nr:RDD family protein [Oceanisphaera pacifica]MBO1519316.1 RDD family protein [Oceanisphaera pacifica]
MSSYSEYIGLSRAGLMRRLAAWLYDVLVVVSLIMVTGFIYFGITVLALKLGWINLGDHEDTAALLSNSPWYQLCLILVALFFYCWFWRTSGQTIGMRAWRLRVQNTDGSRLRLAQCIIRAASALLGLGNLWILVNPRIKLALQDKVADCEVIIMSKELNKKLLDKTQPS